MFEIVFIVSTFASLICGQYVETNDDSDYTDYGGRTLSSNSGPILINPKNQLKGFEPIYVSPDLEDILDQQQYNVYHEEVHGTILMPRISFALNDDDQPIKDDDYGDYVNLVPGVDPKFYSRTANRKKGIFGGCGPGCVSPGSRRGSSVQMFRNPSYNPTIEEMIPYSRIKETPDTYIVMADDPVLAVDSVPKCSKNAIKNEPTTEGEEEEGEEGGKEGEGTETEEGEETTEKEGKETTEDEEESTEGTEETEETSTASEATSSEAEEGEDTTTAEEGAETSTEEEGEETTEEARRRKRRSVVFDSLFVGK